MKKILMIIAIMMMVNTVSAQKSGMGLGVILGEPSGISLKTWANSSTAIDYALAWSFKSENLYGHADYLLHSPIGSGFLFYYGLGVKVIASKDPVIGARVPLGLDYALTGTKLSLFGEVVPGMNLIPETGFDVAGGIGLRYFF